MKQRRAPFTADLRKASYEEWLDVAFDHQPRADPANVDTAWYWVRDVELVVDSARQVRYLTQLFEQPEVLVRRYSAAQIEEGFWFMLGAAGQGWFRDTLWDSEVPWEAREACIKAIPRLYDRLFAPDDEAEGMAWMLWDLLAFDYGCGNRGPAKSDEDRRVQDTMLEAMREMLMRSGSPMAHGTARRAPRPVSPQPCQRRGADSHLLGFAPSSAEVARVCFQRAGRERPLSVRANESLQLTNARGVPHRRHISRLRVRS
jgi:hypothetical protein